MKNLILLFAAGVFMLAGCAQKPTKTIENLKAAYAGESNASAKYAAYAEKAQEESYLSIARLFAAASKAEAIHAANHLKVLQELGVTPDTLKPQFEVKTTAENLEDAIKGETYETETMYPQFINDAKTEKVENAVKSFTWAMDTEKKHKEFYAAAAQAIKDNSLQLLPMGYAVCPVCGNTYDMMKVDEKCAFCQTPKDKFVMF